MATSFHFSWLKFPVDAYFYSDFRYESSACAKAAFLDLLCLAVKRTPLFSIPNNDHTLANWTGLSLRKWRSIKNQVLTMFEFNEEHNCYFCPWLQQQYQDTHLKQDTNFKQDSAEKRALTNAERSRNYRQRQKDKHENVTPAAPSNAKDVPTEIFNAPNALIR